MCRLGGGGRLFSPCPVVHVSSGRILIGSAMTPTCASIQRVDQSAPSPGGRGYNRGSRSVCPITSIDSSSRQQ